MIFKLLIAYETLIVNLLLTHILAEKKYSNLITFSGLFIFTIFTSIALNYVTPLLTQERQTYWFIFIGFLYLLPLYFLYNISFKKLVTIMIYSWTYTMIISSITIGLSNLIHVLEEFLEIFLIQTISILISLRLMIHFTKSKFIVVVNNAADKTKNLLLLLGLSLFAVTSIIRYSISPEEYIYYLLVVFLIVIIITSYILLFNSVQSDINLDFANKIVTQDSLTGIKNRYSLFKDINKLISEEKAFTLLFLDLDDLKSVNDSLGHNNGDEYLKRFAKALLLHTKNHGKSYRFAGDEFVCIIPKENNTFDVKRFENSVNKEMNQHFNFKGVSVGISNFPENGNDPDLLLQVADSKMYGVKNSKRIRKKVV